MAPALAFGSNPIHLRRLRHLAAAVNEGSLTCAALALGQTQPALSASSKSLENELGATYVRRHRRGEIAHAVSSIPNSAVAP